MTDAALAPDIVEAIRYGAQPAEVTLGGLMRPFAVEWTEQRKILSDRYWPDYL